MARASKQSGEADAARLPWDKEGALPIPSGAPKARRGGAPGSGPAPAPRQQPVREEYPGPQTASTGEHVEPGEARPGRRRRGR